MWSKQWQTESWKKKPPYHREAKAWMNGMTFALPYTVCNPYTVQCWTDHSPLTWIKHTSGKGPVSQFIVDMLSQVDYEMNYLKGDDNIVADALSRFPMLGPQRLRRAGMAESLHILLSALLKADIDTTKVWFNTQKDTKFLVSHLYDWCEGRKKLPTLDHIDMKSCYHDTFSESNIKKIKYTFGIWAPPADKITRQVVAALRQNKPFACLIPADLVNYLAIDNKGKRHHDIDEKVEKARKIVFLSTGLVWLIHGVNITDNYKQVYSNERVTPEYELDVLMKNLSSSNLTPCLPQCNTRPQWIQEQRRNRCKELWVGEPKVDDKTQDGLLVYRETEQSPPKTIIPIPLQVPLIKWKQQQMCHMAPKKIFNELKKRYHFKHMFKKCEQVVRDCALCNLLKARMRLAHRHFRAKLFCTPRTSYGADYYGVKQNKLGYNNVLGIIDLATDNLILKAVKARDAANTAHTLFYEIIMRKGVPLRFHSDAAQEFLSTAMTSLQQILGFRNHIR